MKKFMERMAQIAYSINLVNGFDTEVEVFACAENCCGGQCKTLLPIGCGGFFVRCCPQIPAAEITSPLTLFFYIEHTKRVD